MTSVFFPLTIAALLLTATPATTWAQTRLAVEGTEFVLATPDGRTLRSPDLVGSTLKIRAQGRPIEVTIQSVEVDRYAVGGRVVLHRFVVKDDSGKSVDLCTPDAEGRNHGFPVPDGRGGFDLTCTSGVVGKCIRWGYRHWEEQPGGPPLRALHRACVHMARADYGGDGTPSTRDGTLIDIHDHFGIQRFDRKVPMAFEAAWGVDGAVCVARPRIAENISLAQLAHRYPHLARRLGPDSCSEDSAMRDPSALLFNRVFPPEDFGAIRAVGEACGIPIAAGENWCFATQFEQAFAARAVAFAQPSVTKVGGVTEFLKVAAAAETHGVRLAPHTSYFGPGALATLHLLAALGKDARFEYFYLWAQAKLFGAALDPVAGELAVPSAPGLGADPDPEVIRRYRAD